MKIQPHDLIRMLAAGVRPDSGAAPLGKAPLEGADFATLLQRVERGETSSKRPVEIAPDAKVELSDDQHAQLSDLIDRAEAAGAARILVQLDGANLLVDVQTRTIERIIEPGAIEPLLTGIDATAILDTSGEREPAFSTGAAPGLLGTAGEIGRPTAASNASLTQLLAAINAQ